MKKVLSLILLAIMMVSIMPVLTLATEPFASGSGTAGDPYIINTKAQLEAFRDAVNAGNSYSGKYIKLGDNIDLNNEEWTPIGLYSYRSNSTEKSSTVSVEKSFNGIFDGNNKTISNLKISGTNGGKAYLGAGLFGYCNDSFIIKNLTINNADVFGRLYIGAVVGFPYTGTEISNCKVTGNIKIEGSWYVGGIAGNGYVNTIKDCSVIGNNGSYIGGCELYNHNYFNSEYNGYFGGIIGFRGEGSQKIENCTVKNITLKAMCNGLGGISGILHYGNTIENCTIENVTIEMYDEDENDARVGLIAGGNNGISTEIPIVKGCNIINSTAKAIKNKVETKVTSYVGNCGTDMPKPFYKILTAEGKIFDGRVSSDPTSYLLGGVSGDYYVVDNKDGSYSVKKKEVVAQIGTTKYTTLRAAINAVKASSPSDSVNKTITIIGEVDGLVLTSGDYLKGLIIEGSNTGKFTGGITVQGSGATLEDVVIKNLKFDNSNIVLSTALASAKNLTIKNCTFDGKNMAGPAIHFNKYQTKTDGLSIQNNTISNYNGAAILINGAASPDNGSVNISGNTISNVTGNGIQALYINNLVISNNKITNSQYSSGVINVSESKGIINNSTFPPLKWA